MKVSKIIRIVGAALVGVLLLLALAMRINKVTHSNLGTNLHKEHAEQLGCLLAEYSPVSKEIKIGDSIVFVPGSVWVQSAVRLKFRGYIFSHYYEKTHGIGNWKYSSSDELNQHQLVLTSNKYDTTFNRVIMEKQSLLDYELDDQVINQHNEVFDVHDYKNIDTLKFYIKKLHTESLWKNQRGKVISEYTLLRFALDYEPMDSILYYKKK